MIASQTAGSTYHEQFANLVERVQQIKSDISNKAKTDKEVAHAMQFELDIDIAISTKNIAEVKQALKQYGVSL